MPDFREDAEERPVDLKDFSTFATEAIKDGTAVLLHDGFDVQSWQESLRDYPKLKQAEANALKEVPIGSALLRDTFFGFYKRAPVIMPPVPLRPEYLTNKTIIQDLLEAQEYKEARAAGTVGDTMLSAVAALEVGTALIKSIPKEKLQALNRLSQAQAEANRLFDQIENTQEQVQQAQEQSQAQPQNKQAETLGKQQNEQAQKMRKQLEAAQQKVIQATQESQLTEAEAGVVRRAARAASQRAEEEIDNINSALNMFGGDSYSLSESNNSPISTMSGPERLRLATKIAQSKNLQKLAEMCGRLLRIAMQVQRTKLDKDVEEVVAITIGRDIPRVLPSELLLLGNPDTENVFFQRFIENRLLQYDVETKQKVGKGPIIVALDSSGSMQGDKEAWSKGVALALLAIARKQKRNLMVMHFASPNQLKVQEFVKGVAVASEIITLAEFFYNGGTDFGPWMARALKSIDDSKYDKADVIVISDGVTYISEEDLMAWQRRRKEREMRCFSILIGTDQGKELLERMSDGTFTLEDLKKDSPVLERVFSV